MNKMVDMNKMVELTKNEIIIKLLDKHVENSLEIYELNDMVDMLINENIDFENEIKELN